MSVLMGNFWFCLGWEFLGEGWAGEWLVINDQI